MDIQVRIKEILSSIETQTISPQEGYQIIQDLKKGNGASLLQSGSPLYRSVIVDKPVAIGDVVIQNTTSSDPKRGEVQILVKAFSINFGDLLCVKGFYPTMPEYPFTPGFEVAGVVLKTGDGVTGFQVGDEVIALTGSKMGGHSYVVNTEAHLVIKKPRQISFEEACAFPVVYLTTQAVFEKAQLKQGEKVLIQTAAGGTGLVAVQYALAQGAEVFATAGSQRKIEYLRAMGVHHAINYKEEDFYQKIKTLTNGYGVDVVLNTLSGENIQKGLDILAPDGRYIEIAMLGLRTSDHFSLANLVDNQSFHSINIRKLLTRQSEKVQDYLERMVENLHAGSIKPIVGKIFPFDQINEAYRFLEQGENIGKVVVTNPVNIEDYLKGASKSTQTSRDHTSTQDKEERSGDIAIIGIAGRFPGGDNLEEFWTQLAQGKDGVDVIPKVRWDVEKYYDADPKVLDKTYCKWGGTLKNIDMFDANFFNISGKEAELTDPQQRLFLEECWNALEDAGYATEDISNKKCGVFVGVSGGDYLTRLQEEGVQIEAQSFWGNASSVLASRISYFLNLKGPSVSIDTACSSSLVSIHLGCQSILSGESEMVIAGGVFISLTPMFNILSSNANMLSPDGKCKTFDNEANGFVPGEGVGAVVLKSLEQAIQDGDSIYGVIKGSAINQDGKTNGLTAPSTLSQTEVELTTYKKAKISPETIQYVEAHGTGTKLGDPIEIEALTNSFRKYTDKKQFCAIGSVKTNIGHAAAAAGVASVIKVLLAMKYQKIPPSLHFNQANQHIDFASTPFFVNTSLKEWEVTDQEPRRAAISSFGFSGTNAHMVIEEFVRQPSNLHERNNYFIVPISARTTKSYERKIEDLIQWLEQNKQAKLTEVSYTLLIARRHFPIRGALVVQSLEELTDQLKKLVNKEKIPNYYFMNLRKENIQQELAKLQKGKSLLHDLSGNLQDDQALSYLLQLTELYTQGYDFDWNQLFKGESVQKLSMPTYPFVKQRYWIPQTREQHQQALTKDIASRKVDSLHPLLDKNTSTVKNQRFSKVFSGVEPFLVDHIVNGVKMLPGVCYLEMAMAASRYSLEEESLTIRNVIWASPIIAEGEEKEVNFSLQEKGDVFNFEIFSLEGNHKTTHAQGKISKGPSHQKDELALKVDQIIERCSVKKKKDECYELFNSIGFTYGPTFQALHELYCGSDEALVHLVLPDELEDTFEEYTFHPSLIDGALQGVIGYLLSSVASLDNIYLPFAIGEVQLQRPLEKECFAYVKPLHINDSNMKKFDVYLVNQRGETLISIKDFTCRAMEKKPVHQESEERGIVSYHSVWDKNQLQGELSLEKLKGSILLFVPSDLDDHMVQKFIREKSLERQVIVVQSGEAYECVAQDVFRVRCDNQDDYFQLIEELHSKQMLPENIIHLWGMTPISKQATDIEAIELQSGLGALDALLKAYLKKDQMPSHILVQYMTTQHRKRPEYAALAGFFKSLQLENPNISCQLIEIEQQQGHSEESSYGHWLGISLKEITAEKKDIEIKYIGEERYIKISKEIDFNKETALSNPIRKHGVYVITGGLGGLGYLFAEYLSKEYHSKLILIGRSQLDPLSEEKLKKLNALGGECQYIQADVSRPDETKELITQTKRRYGQIHGIIHCAGVIRDSLFTKKTKEEMDAVLSAKVFGTVHLDQFTKNENLDFFVLFSSMAAMKGNIGQTDYAYANQFMDEYARLRKEANSSGKTLSIGWPLWQEGGMRLDEATEKFFANSIGIIGIPNEIGISAFEKALTLLESQVTVLFGDRPKIRKWVESSFEEKTPTLKRASEYSVTEKKIGTEKAINEVKEAFEIDVVAIVSNLLKIDLEEIELTEHLEEYGFDSLTLTDFANQLSETFNLDITPATFFGHATLGAIADFVFQENTESLVTYYQSADSGEITEGVEKDSSLNRSEETQLQKDKPMQTLETEVSIVAEPEQSFQLAEEPIAIIGMSGIMPKSEDLDQFWENLATEQDLISEIPRERWDWKRFDGDPLTDVNKTNVKWGGFMREVDKFDPLFFGISPREAELMDPQQRIFLETVWKTIEDAGYKASELSGTDTGLFVGVSTSDYNEILQDTIAEVEAQTSTGMSHCMLANRISYFFNFHGPSEPVNTACSSALVAIHRAVEAIQLGNCQMAIAGGINVMLTPTLHISFSKAGMLSQDGRCKTFDKSADGYVRGEGSGAVLLKSLSKAKQDGDHIYAVIKGSVINHGGRTNSLTAPNPLAQANLLVQAYEKAKIDPTTVSYIEAHGTGTNLGDPVEINGIKSAFRTLYEKWDKENAIHPTCGIGSVKSNIGHLEAAAGIAGLFKVILSMKNKLLPATLHVKEQNPYINLENTPFYITKESSEWLPLKDAQRNPIPRRAGLSSFGFGGVNAHVVLEEYIDQEREGSQAPQIIVLSAKNKSRLKDYTRQLLTFINKQKIRRTSKDKVKIATQTQIEQNITQIVSRILNINEQEIEPKEHFTEYGFDQIYLEQLRNEINEYYQLDLLTNTFRNYPSIKDLADFLLTENEDLIVGRRSDLEEDSGLNGLKDKFEEYTFHLSDLAFTLQVGREEMEERLAIITSSVEELEKGLLAFIENREIPHYIFYGNAKGKSGGRQSIESQEERDEIAQAIKQKDLSQLALLWVEGKTMDWRQLHENDHVRRTPLPTYPFEKERYWLPEPTKGKVQKEYSDLLTNERLETITQEEIARNEEKEKNDDRQLLETLRRLQSGELSTKEVSMILGT